LIVGGALFGLLVGLLLGDYAAVFDSAGNAYIRLLQMTVLPYIVVTLVASFARLTSEQGRRLLIEGGAVMLLLWTFGLFNVWAFSQALPEWNAGSFFSSATTGGASTINFVELFIPSNLFASLSDGVIPAVVTFCVATGFALARVPNRGKVISHLDALAKTFTGVNHFVVRLTPIGVFALAAQAAGTMSLNEAARLQGYVILYAAASVLVTFGILPGFIIAVTPFRYRDVMAVSKDALITALATGKLLVVLPLLIEATEKLVQDRFPDEATEGNAAPAVDVLYPLAYSVPHMGKLFSILFIPFAAWFLGNSLTTPEYPRLLLAGMASSFGGPIVSTPFLLEMMHLPDDMFQLFLLSGVVCGRLSDMVGVMHLVAFTTVTTCVFTGHLRGKTITIVKYLAVSTFVGVLCVFATRAVLRTTLKYIEPRDEVIASLQLLSEPADHVVLTDASPNPVPLRPGQSLLSRVRERGAIRIGYNADKLPFAYFNIITGDLVGYDISLAHQLARDLGVRIEFVPFDRETLADQLREDDFDIVMSGLVGTLERAETMTHTRPYLDVTLSFVAEDHRVRSFRSLDSLRKIADLKIGFIDLSRGFVNRLEDELPDAELVELRTNRQFFEGAYQEVDGLLISAESGSAFTLFYPQFGVVVPTDQQVSLPLFYAVGNNDEAMRAFLEHWIELRVKDGTYQSHYDHWILGKDQSHDKPRWNILTDVLGWGKQPP
jgi:Na+/H+-dicarboxylate symporter